MYTYSSKNNSRVVHLVNEISNKTFCKYENNSQARGLDLTSTEIPKGKRLCFTCNLLSGRSKKTGKKPFVSVSKKFYSSREWHKLRYEAFLKYGAKCMCCGSTSILHVDHIKPISLYPELATDINNLQVLCAVCNSGKGAWDQTDWRK